MRDRKLGHQSWIGPILSDIPGVYKYMLSQNFFIFTGSSIETKWRVLDYDQVMMISDTITSRAMSIIYNRMLPNETPGQVDEELLINIYDELDRCLTLNGNEAYSEIAMWEPCCVSLMYKLHDRLKSSQLYVGWFEAEIKTNGFQGISKIYSLMNEKHPSMPELAEFHGIYRHWGHPTVDEALGCEKVRTIGTTRSQPVDETALKVAGAVKKQFVASMISKKGCWPKIVIPETLMGKPIERLVREQRKVINFYSEEYPLIHWGLLRFGQEFDFDYHEDFTSFIEDRSISCYRKDLRTVYN
jgi:hypothetical protein